jgi:glycosyltransferase involved in cell wall biosynthesis
LHLFSLKIVCLLKGKILITDWLEVWGKKHWIEYLGFFKGYLAFIIEWLSTKIPNNIISISDFTTNRLIRNFKVQKTKILTFPCGIELEDINQAKSQGDRQSDCIFVGRLLKHKNVDMIIRAVKYASDHSQPKIRCIIIGDGPEKPFLEKLANQLNLQNNILFLGFIAKHEDVYSYMKSSKIFVFPSQREGFGMVVLEANACGLPVLAVKSDFSALSDLISENINGYLLEPTPEVIGKTIINLLVSPERLNDLSQKSITLAKNYSWDIIVKKMEISYKEIFAQQ